MSDKKKFSVVIAGGGSTYTPEIILMLLDNLDRLPLRAIKMYDNDGERQGKLAPACEILIHEKDPSIEFIATTDPETAYTDVDFCLAHIRVGQLPMRVLDEQIPLKYGRRGPGDLRPWRHRLRHALHPRRAREHRLHGEVLAQLLDAQLLQPGRHRGRGVPPRASQLPRDQHLRHAHRPGERLCPHPRLQQPQGDGHPLLRPESLRLVHLYQDAAGEELLPKLIEHEKLYGNTMPEDGADAYTDDSWRQTALKARDLVAIEPTMATNTYLQYYLYGDDMVAHTDPHYTRANQVIDGREKRVFGECARIAEAGTGEGTSLEIGIHAEFIVDLATALAFNTHERMLLIVPNNGAIENFDDDAMVEIPCIVGKDGYEPLSIGKIPTFQKGLMEEQVAVEKLVVDAWQQKSYIKMWQALTLSKTVPSANVAKKILDDFIEVNKDYWPELH